MGWCFPKASIGRHYLPIGFTPRFGRKYPVQCPRQRNNPLRQESVYCYFRFSWGGTWVPEMQLTSLSSQLLSGKKRAQACLWLQARGSPLSWLALASERPNNPNLCQVGGSGSVPAWERSQEEGNGNLLQHSCLEYPMERGAQRAAVHGVTKSQK